MLRVNPESSDRTRGIVNSHWKIFMVHIDECQHIGWTVAKQRHCRHSFQYGIRLCSLPTIDDDAHSDIVAYTARHTHDAPAGASAWKVHSIGMRAPCTASERIQSSSCVTERAWVHTKAHTRAPNSELRLAFAENSRQMSRWCRSYAALSARLESWWAVIRRCVSAHL